MRPWKLSMWAFCVGFPGRMCTNSICRSTHQARKCRLVSSGPLSQRVLSGRPRSTTISSNTRVTLRLAKLVSTTMRDTLVCKRPRRLVLGWLVHTPPHRARNPASTPDLPLSMFAAADRSAHSVCASFAECLARAPGTRDVPVCGSLLLRFAAAEHAAVDTQTEVSLLPTPPAALATLHRTAWLGTDNSIPLASSEDTLSAR